MGAVYCFYLRFYLFTRFYINNMSIFNFEYAPGYFYNHSKEVEVDLKKEPTEKIEKDWHNSSSIQWGDVEDVMTPSIIAVVVLVGVVCGVWRWCRGRASLDLEVTPASSDWS